jgi:hypothetical protein
MTGLNYLGRLVATTQATHLIIRHGLDALSEALTRADACFERQDLAGAGLWRAVADETAAAMAGSERRLAELAEFAPSHVAADARMATNLSATTLVEAGIDARHGRSRRRPQKAAQPRMLPASRYVEDAPLGS